MTQADLTEIYEREEHGLQKELLVFEKSGSLRICLGLAGLLLLAVLLELMVLCVWGRPAPCHIFFYIQFVNYFFSTVLM